MNENRCTACGEIIPEGRQVCLHCEKRKSQMLKEIQIEELALHLLKIASLGIERYGAIATKLYNAGYRKVEQGEWERVEVNGVNYGQVYYHHKNCKVNETEVFPSPHKHCPNCGAKMKGAE